MARFLRTLERIFKSHQFKSRQKDRTKKLKKLLLRLEALEARELLSVAPNDAGAIALVSALPMETAEEALIDAATIKAQYLDTDGKIKDVLATVVTSSMTGNWQAGWYIVNSNVTMTNASVTCKGDVKLILADGCSLNVTGDSGKAGMNVSDGNRLTIYGQKAGTGKLTATGGDFCAGIGGNEKQKGENITVNGGKIEAKGGKYAAGIGGGNQRDGKNITINGGEVTAAGGDRGAGIGGGGSDNYFVRGKDGVDITIKGGEVTATGGYYAAGIGGGGNLKNSFPHGGDGINITIENGKVTANGGYCGAGIGGANDHGHGKNIKISGGLVTATGGDYGAGIGGGWSGNADGITITGGTVNASGGASSSGIGGGDGGSSKNIKVNKTSTLMAGTFPDHLAEITNDGGDLASSLSGATYRFVKIFTKAAPSKTTVSYRNEQGKMTTVTATVIDKSFTGNWQAGWYVVNSIVVIEKSAATCVGDVKLILADGCSLTVIGASGKAGINVSGSENSLTIYGQKAGTGKLTATGGYRGAGIGGNFREAGENITIIGGTIVANGGQWSAGIGGGDRGAGQNITIDGGNVTAYGSQYATGIGGGSWGIGQNITINGGNVTAFAKQGTNGIGSGSNVSIAENIEIATKLVTKAGDNAASAAVLENEGGDLSEALHGKKYVSVLPQKEEPEEPENALAAYVDENGETQTVEAAVVDESMIGVWGEGWYIVKNDVTLDNASVTCRGDVRLILADGASLTVTGTCLKPSIGVSGVGNSLTVYGQAEGSGKLTATGGAFRGASNVTINTELTVRAGADEESAKELENSGDDLAAVLDDETYVSIKPQAQEESLPANAALPTDVSLLEDEMADLLADSLEDGLVCNLAGDALFDDFND